MTLSPVRGRISAYLATMPDMVRPTDSRSRIYSGTDLRPIAPKSEAWASLEHMVEGADASVDASLSFLCISNEVCVFVTVP